jgi:hypothetical protein
MVGFTRGEERHYTRDVLNRRKALVGYLTYRFVRLVLRREALRRVDALRPSGSSGSNGSNGQHDRQGGLMIKQRTRSAGAAAAGSATALVETVRPIVQKAINDPELHDALRKAFATGREVTGEIQKNKPSKAARNIAENRKLHRRVESSVQDLQKAVSSLVEESKAKKKSGRKRILGTIAVLGAIAGGVFVALRKLRGGQQDDGGV